MTGEQPPALDAVLLGIEAAVRELADDDGLLDQLAELLHESSPRPELSTGRRPPSSRPPWEAGAAGVALTVHAFARDTEADLRAYVFGTWRRRRGGSDTTTKVALHRIALLARHPEVPEVEVRRCARLLGQHVLQAQQLPAIDTAPAPPATLRYPCPACGEGALQAAVDGSTAITCSNPACTDDAGRRTSWPRHRWPHLLGQVLQ